MKTETEPVTKTALIKDVMKVCNKASRRGFCDQHLSDQLFSATVMWIYFILGDDAIVALLDAAMRDVKNGDFARMLKEAGFIERVHTS